MDKRDEPTLTVVNQGSTEPVQGAELIVRRWERNARVGESAANVMNLSAHPSLKAYIENAMGKQKAKR